MNNNLKYGNNLHKEYPKTCAKDDFWGQVCRTVNGKPVEEDDILLIVSQITKYLKFDENDVLLDLCCGNGALSNYLFNNIKGYLGVDFSEYLISVAKNNFETNTHSFLVQDAVKFVQDFKDPLIFHKALCYGAFSYFDDTNAEVLLRLIFERFSNISKIFVGNLPDRNLADYFYIDPTIKNKYMDDPQSSLGIWRTKDQLSKIANDCGWNAEFSVMPKEFYAAHYRHDLILYR